MESQPPVPDAPEEGTVFTVSDYVAVASFDDLPLSEPVRSAIAAKGYTRPTPVQAASLKPILAGRDTLVRSKTGTGKTAAFGIPMVELIDPARGHVQGLVLCNTRELAMQVAGEIESLGANKGVKVVAIYGGASMDDQLRALRGGAQVVVGTPGRILDLLKRGTLSLRDVRIAVLDEADEMLGVGFFEDVMRILGHCPKERQTLLFSATLTPDLERLIRTHLKDPETILLSGDVYTVAGIRNIFYYAEDSLPKPRNLLMMMQLENPETAIIFCNTRDDVNLVTTVLNRNGFDADKLSGELAQKDRERVMGRIKRGELRFMVATDLAARGIDISDLTHVINYSLPEDPAVYLHRVGRTGRIGKTGTAVSIVRGPELVTLSALQKKFGITFEERKMPTAEEARRMWTETHVAELRGALGEQLFDAYIPLAQDLKAKDGGEVLLAFALKYFFTHHRMERAATPRQDEERKVEKAKAVEHKEGLNERRRERSRPKLELLGEAVAEGAAAPGGEARAAPGPTPKPKPEPKPNRLYVSIGTQDGVDDTGLRAALAELSGAAPEAITLVEQRQAHSYVEIVPESVPSFVAANGKAWREKSVTIEVARPPSGRRRR
jgi:ATP-dependent RNA helicase DeaD